MKNTQDVQTLQALQNAQDIQSARIQWDTGISTKDGSESFDFPEVFGNANPAVIVNRTKANAKNILPVISADNLQYTINRNDDVDGSQPFNMLAIGALTAGGANYSKVLDGGNQVAMIQWGTATSTSDKDQDFEYPTPFEYNSYAVLTNRKKSGAKDNLPVVDAGAESFTINRNDGVDGSQPFYWIAVGDCLLDELGTFSFPIGGGYVMKGGLARSTSDSAQQFNFKALGLDDFSTSCYAVVTTRTKSGSKDVLAVTGMSKTAFTIDRNGGIDGTQEFYWVAIGK